MDQHLAMEAYVRVVDTGSFSGAARQMKIGQPAVSKAIADGKLLPSQKAWAIGASPKAFKSYLASLGDNVVVPLGEHKPVSEEVAKARAADGLPKAELSKSEKKFAAQMGRTEDEIIKMKADRSPV